jgi:hypothetical protein
MLLPADVVPFLLHEDADVREHALEYLAKGHDCAPATADDVWAAMDRYGDAPTRFASNERARFAAELAHFHPTPRSTERLFNALRTDATSDLGVHLLHAARELPPAAVRALLTDEAIRTQLPAAMIAEIDADLVLVETSFDALWTALSGAAVELGDTWQLDSPVYRRALHLVRAIARSPEQAAARGLESLGGGIARAPVEANMELLAVELFGRIRYPGPLEPLLRLLGEEGDYVNERVADALVRVGTPEVVAAVASGLPGTEPFLTYAPGVIARIRRPESEAVLLRLLEAETDLYRRTELAMYLLDLCATSAEALGLVEQMVEDGAYDSMLVDLDELLVTAGKMVGWSPRDPEAWEAKPKLVRPMLAAQAALQRLTERMVSPAPARPRPEPRGFVPFGKKARKKKTKERRSRGDS